MSKGFVIAIDGPVASGKGTIAQKLAKELSGFYLYTGAMYRCIALLVIERGLNLENEQEVESVLPELNIEFVEDAILLNGKDVTERIKNSDTASGASKVGVFPNVRQFVDKNLRIIAEKISSEGKIVVSEGRDTATTIFPNAPIKIYLTARDEIRAMRRMEQFVNQEKNLDQELERLKTRDKRDTEREASPLPSNPESLGYFVLDNSDLSEEQTLDVINKELVNKGLIDPESSSG